MNLNKNNHINRLLIKLDQKHILGLVPTLKLKHQDPHSAHIRIVRLDSIIKEINEDSQQSKLTMFQKRILPDTSPAGFYGICKLKASFGRTNEYASLDCGNPPCFSTEQTNLTSTNKRSATMAFLDNAQQLDSSELKILKLEVNEFRNTTPSFNIPMTDPNANNNIVIILSDHRLPQAAFVDNLLSRTIQNWGVVKVKGELMLQFVHNMSFHHFKCNLK